MSTVTALKNLNHSDIRDKVDPDTISPTNVSDRLDAIVDEFLSRGVKYVLTTGNLGSIAGADGDFVFINGGGFYKYVASVITPDGAINFAASDGNTWVKVEPMQVLFNSNSFMDYAIKNFSTGTGAFAGLRFYNSNGIGAQIGYGSPLNSFGNNLFLFHCVPGSCRIASNSGAVEFGIGGNAAVNVKGGFKATSGHFYLVAAACPIFADNAAALAGGLVADDVYKTATGELRITV
jgi:hypothetical protein